MLPSSISPGGGEGYILSCLLPLILVPGLTFQDNLHMEMFYFANGHRIENKQRRILFLYT